MTTTNLNCPQGELHIFASAYGYITLNTKKQICSFLRLEDEVISFKIVNSQMQQNAVLCGLFDIAAAVELAAGSNPVYSLPVGCHCDEGSPHALP